MVDLFFSSIVYVLNWGLLDSQCSLSFRCSAKWLSNRYACPCSFPPWKKSRILNISHRILRRRQWHPTPVLLPGKSHGRRSLAGCSPWGRKSRTRPRDFTFTFHFHALEKEMAPHSSVLAGRIPGMGEPGGLPSMGLRRVGHDWSNLAAAAAVKLY